MYTAILALPCLRARVRTACRGKTTQATDCVKSCCDVMSATQRPWGARHLHPYGDSTSPRTCPCFPCLHVFRSHFLTRVWLLPSSCCAGVFSGSRVAPRLSVSLCVCCLATFFLRLAVLSGPPLHLSYSSSSSSCCSSHLKV